MNPHLNNALTELRGHGASGLPSKETIAQAPNGKEWKGKLPQGTWKLIKHKEDSYTTNTQVNS